MEKASSPSSRFVLIHSKLDYDLQRFIDASLRRGVSCVQASDRCHVLEDPWGDGAIPIRFDRPAEAVDRIVAYARDHSLDAILSLGDRGGVIAATVREALGLGGHSLDATEKSSDKYEFRRVLKALGLANPSFQILDLNAPWPDACPMDYPAVLKPRALSASRGVIRVDDDASFQRALKRIASFLQEPELAAELGPLGHSILVESYIPGGEWAIEAMMSEGRLYPLAIFQKPDPLEGPYFAETIYSIDTDLGEEERREMLDLCQRAAIGVGLDEGPIHAELRVGSEGAFLLEIAGRRIGGRCGRILETGLGATLEDIILQHALRGTIAVSEVRSPCGVMMIPVTKGGIFKGVRGVEAALGIQYVEHVDITAKVGQRLRPLPEGGSYMGFIFARAPSTELVNAALRQAVARLDFQVNAEIPVLG